MITLDFETRSRCDLKACGTSVYARHPSTEVMCFVWYHNKWYGGTWIPGDEPHAELLDLINQGELVEAHNAFFERNIWRHIMHKRHGWPDVPFEQWRCSLAACCRLTLPRGLDQAGKALKLEIQKDEVGKRIMQRLCKPKKPSKVDPSEWDNDPDKFQRLYQYCKQDVLSEMAISEAIEPLTPSELKVWQLDQRINLRGLAVDRDAIEHAIALVNQVYEDTVAELREVTEGVIETPGQLDKIKQFLSDEVGEAPDNLRAETVTQWLDRDDLTPNARRVLELRQLCSKASTKKLKAMLDRCDEDGRVRGNLVYHGASTGRWAGAGIQIQNYPRGNMKPEEIEIVHDLLPMESADALDLIFGSPMDCISSSLRSMVVAEPGNRLMVADFAQIEARVLAWLAGQDDLLMQFAQGADVYKSMATKIYGVDEFEIDKEQRHVGKTAILGLGYSMGFRAFRSACWTMAGVKIDNKLARKVVKTYRDANPAIVAIWKDLNNACKYAIKNHATVDIGKLEVTADDTWMKIRLPSGRQLHYREPHLVEVVAPWSKGYYGKISYTPDLQEQLEDAGISLGGDQWDDCDVPPAGLKALKELGIKYSLEKKEPQLIEQIQFWGVDSQTKQWRKQRTYGGCLCLGKDTEVLTSTGWKRIGCVLDSDFLWDGVEWVSHEGVVDQGVQLTIYQWACWMTPDHRVLTTEGWRSASQLSGLTREKVRLPNCGFLRGVRREKELVEMQVQVREGVRKEVERDNAKARLEQSQLWVYGWHETNDTWYVQTSSVCGLAFNDGQVQAQNAPGVSQLWSEGNQGLRSLDEVRELLGRHGVFLQERSFSRQNRQRRGLRTEQLPMGDGEGSREQQTNIHVGREDREAGSSVERGNRYIDIDPVLPVIEWVANTQAYNGARRYKQTYDILNAGPRRRFTVRAAEGCEPFLSHNCENVTQAVAGDFLREAMLRVEQASYPIVATVHDEVICEVPNGHGSLDEFNHIMGLIPRWGRGCPIGVEGFEAMRYRK